MCGNSDLSTAETVPFPSLKPTVRPLKQAGPQKDRLPTIHFQGWNQLGWRLFWWIYGWKMGFTFLIETLRKRCEDNIISVGWFGTFEVCARCFLESWFWARQTTNLGFMSGQRCGCLEFGCFFPTKRTWGDDRVEDLQRCLVHTIYPLNQVLNPLKSLFSVKMGEKRGLPRSMSSMSRVDTTYGMRMGFMVIHVQLLIVCTFEGPYFAWFH